MKLSQFTQRVDQLIAQGERVLTTTYTPAHWPLPHVDSAAFTEWRTSSVALLHWLFGESGTHSIHFSEKVKSNEYDQALQGVAILRAAKADVAAGILTSLTALAQADVFSDFVEMAQHLLDQRYKDAAAVIIGSVLEEHLRKLCTKNQIATEVQDRSGKMVPKKADVMNADLAKAQNYGSIDQKSVTSWLGLRNSAAHGKYGDYTEDQVKLMLDGVLSFMARVPL